jgi:hypothetical protein
MAKYKIKTDSNVTVEYRGGVVSGTINRRGRAFVLYTPKLSNTNRLTLNDFSEAVKLACRHIGKVIGRNVSVQGRKVDPDEPAWDVTKNLTVTYQIYRNDPNKKLTFTRYVEDGRVAAELQAFIFSDIPSAIQAAAVAMRAAQLMLAYERE